MSRDFDSPWKETLDLFLKQILQLFFPDLHAAIDWSRGYESLDTELQAILRESELGKTLADKLFRVRLLTGEDVCLLIHLEVQSQVDEDFPARMFVYHYRIRDRYNEAVVSLAILGDDSPAWRPTEYLQNNFGCEIRFRFRTIKLLDWAVRAAELRASPNPIALIVLAHLDSLATNGDLPARYQSKSQLIRGLLNRGLQPKQIRQLYRLIDWLLELPSELQEQLRIDIHKYEEEQRMKFVSSFERLAKEEGLKEGRLEELLEGLSLSLELKFGEAGKTFAEELQSLSDLTQLKAIQKAIRAANNVDELRAIPK